MSDEYLTSLVGIEGAFKAVLTGTGAVTLLTAGANGTRVTLIRAVNVTANTPTLALGILSADGLSTFRLRGVVAMTAGQVYVDDFGARLLPGEKLVAQAGAGNEVHCTGLYVDPPRGPRSVPA